MNWVWLILVAASLVYGLATGSVTSMNEVIINVGKETLDFAIPLVAATCFWSGILNMARRIGLLNALQKAFSPLLRWLFPDLRNNPEALGYIAANITINMFGLGFAATPSGLKAMECMQRDNPDKSTASRAMVTFLVLNTAGVTIISTTIIALRAQFGAANPSDTIPLAIAATVCASVGGLLFDRVVNYREH